MREKRLLVGWLALLAPVPLPFNEVLEWPVLGIYVAAVIFFLRRAAADPHDWLPAWAMNLLGLAYLPLLYIDFALRWNGQLVRPVVHLAMFAVVIKLFALRREKDKWQTLFGVFFLFLASMATSVHPSVVVYLIAFLALTLTLLTRFSLFSVLARFGYQEWSLQQVPLAGFVTVATLLSFVIGIPLFAVLPRIKSPFIMGRGAGTGTVIRASGFSDQVSLDSIGSIRQSREIALRIDFESESGPQGEVRLKAGSYERYEAGGWKASPPEDFLTPKGPGGFRLGEAVIGSYARFWLQPLNSRSLPLPVEAAQVELRATGLNVDRGGAFSLIIPPNQILEYRVAMSRSGELMLAQPPRTDGGPEPTLSTSGITPGIRGFAEEIAGSGSPADQAEAIERFLGTEFEYTTDFVGRTSGDPIEQFLLETRRGHCEYFASAMVLMLRSRNIPARLVTGFLGAEANPLENYFVVRQSNAHAWVEAYLPDEGWKTFDPTPPDGRPGVEEGGLGLLAAQVWDFVSFRWDRYVLTFGFYDQYQIASRFRSLWRSLWGSRRSPEREDAEVTEPIAVPTVTEGTSATAGERDLRAVWLLVGLVWLGCLVGVVWWWRHRAPMTATRAYLRLRQRLSGAGMPVPDAMAPLAFRRSLVLQYPDLEMPATRLTNLYLDEAFGGRTIPVEQLAEVAEALAQVEEGLRRAG
ncbi:MAG: DUF3488 and transglutaminase-like domain-containing protein [Thermoanaerobaculia bacterium]|nr:DUF3488 and transglutaminase-like domain-containing protein [Thermoanaerobaculia bacterium]